MHQLRLYWQGWVGSTNLKKDLEEWQICPLSTTLDAKNLKNYKKLCFCCSCPGSSNMCRPLHALPGPRPNHVDSQVGRQLQRVHLSVQRATQEVKDFQGPRRSLPVDRFLSTGRWSGASTCLVWRSTIHGEVSDSMVGMVWHVLVI